MLTIQLLAITVLISGCSYLPDFWEKSSDVPGWVTRLPQGENEICAVGTSDTTFFRNDAVTYATENARQELSRSLSVSIYSVMIDKQRGNEADSFSSNVMEITAGVSEKVLKGAQIVATWYDEQGSAPVSKKGMTYALACIDKGAAQ